MRQILAQTGQAKLKDKLPKNKALLFGLLPALFLILFGFELLQFGLILITGADNFQTGFYGLWFNVNLLTVDNNPYLLIPLSLLPVILSILLLELSANNYFAGKLNTLSLLVFQLLILTYLLLKVILSSITPLIFSDFINDISVVLKYYEYSNSLKYLNVLFVVFAFIIYFNRLSTKLSKKLKTK